MRSYRATGQPETSDKCFKGHFSLWACHNNDLIHIYILSLAFATFMALIYFYRYWISCPLLKRNKLIYSKDLTNFQKVLRHTSLSRTTRTSWSGWPLSTILLIWTRIQHQQNVCDGFKSRLIIDVSRNISPTTSRIAGHYYSDSFYWQRKALLKVYTDHWDFQSLSTSLLSPRMISQGDRRNDGRFSSSYYISIDN